VAVVGEPSWLVVLPTHDHPTTIAYAAASALAQEVEDLRLVVIGDGVAEETRDVVADLCRGDARVSFVDRPKAPSRNEAARHEVVSASAARFVTYLGDDDLFLPDHLGTMQELLAAHDFAHPAPVFVLPSGEMEALPTDLADSRCVRWHLHPGRNAVSLTGAAHTGDLYRRLPFGWRPAPPGRCSDHYMWEQVFTVADVRLATAVRATTVKLAADKRVGVDGADRAEEIRWWSLRITSPGFRAQWDADVADAVRRAAVEGMLRAGELSDELVGAYERLAVAAGTGIPSPGGGPGVPPGEHAALLAEHRRVTQAMERVTGTRTWRLRNRVIGSRRVDPMVAGRPGRSQVPGG
jgi:glycosyltransferase involved in cell wall biosynthesis